MTTITVTCSKIGPTDLQTRSVIVVYCGDNNIKNKNNIKRVICRLQQVNTLEFKHSFLSCIVWVWKVSKLTNPVFILLLLSCNTDSIISIMDSKFIIYRMKSRHWRTLEMKKLQHWLRTDLHNMWVALIKTFTKSLSTNMKMLPNTGWTH